MDVRSGVLVFYSERMQVVYGTCRTFVQGRDGLTGGCVCHNLLVFVGAAKPDQSETNFMADSRDGRPSENDGL